MRPSLTLVPRAAAVAAAAVLLSACGGSEGGSAGGSASPSSSASSSAAETSESEAPEDDSKFCTQSQELLDGLGAAFSDQDPASVETAFSQAAEGFRSVEPPAEIEQDWTTLGDGLEEYAAAFAELDQQDPESVTAFQQRTSSLQGELTGAATNVETYLNEECGIDTDAEPSGAGESTAPSS